MAIKYRLKRKNFGIGSFLGRVSGVTNFGNAAKLATSGTFGAGKEALIQAAKGATKVGAIGATGYGLYKAGDKLTGGDVNNK